MNYNRKPFSNQITVLMDEYGTGKLSTITGISDTMLRKWRAGTSLPGLDKLLALSDATGRSVEWLATGHEPSSPNHYVCEPKADYRAKTGDNSPLSYEESISLVGENLRCSRRLYESAVKLSNYEPDRLVGENIKSIIFDSFVNKAVDVKTITRLLESLKDNRE